MSTRNVITTNMAHRIEESTLEIVEFLRERGYNVRTLEKVKDSRVTKESVHLLKVADFKSFGVALADARLLIETFQARDKTADLKELVTSIRRKESKLPPGPASSSVSSKSAYKRVARKATVTVDFSWHHWDIKDKRFKMVRQSKGGGLRQKHFHKGTSLDTVYDELKRIYFPNGKNKTGNISAMMINFCGADLEPVNMDLENNISDYIEKLSLKSCKFVLKTRIKTIKDIDCELSSDEDFQLELTPMKQLNNVPQYFEHETINPSDTLSTGNDTFSSLSPSFTESSKERSALIYHQDKEFQESLLTDQAKEITKILEEEERNLHLSKRMERYEVMKKLVVEEPSLHEDCVVIVVLHTKLGRLERLFSSNRTFEDIYYWLGSLSKDPEHFTLSIGNPGNTQPPNATVTNAERKIVMMNEVDEEVFKFPRLQSNMNHKVVNSADVNADGIKESVCPVCGLSIPLNCIATHADACATQRYIEVFDSDEEFEEEEKMESSTSADALGNIESAKQEKSGTEILQTLKFLLELKCNVDASQGLALKIRRNHTFEDFCTRFSLQWVRKKIPALFVVSFIGETGVDLGGLRREFFSEAISELKVALFTKKNDGYEPITNSFCFLAENKYKLAGELIASSLAMQGSAPNFFAPWIYSFLVHGIDAALNNLQNVKQQDGEMSDLYNQLLKVHSSEELQQLLSTESALDLLSDIGYKGMPQRAKIDDKASIMRSMLLKERVQPVLAALEQFKEGLCLYGVLDLARSNEEVFRAVFVKNEFLSWTFEKFEDFVCPTFSEDGSNKKSLEIDCYKVFLDAMEFFFYNGEELKLAEVMKFISGSASIPPLGYPSKLKVLFKHWCSLPAKDCRCKPTVSTCSLSITLPVHYRTMDAMKEAISDAVKMSQGMYG